VVNRVCIRRIAKRISQCRRFEFGHVVTSPLHPYHASAIIILITLRNRILAHIVASIWDSYIVTRPP
jgi:hypothetical protein